MIDIARLYNELAVLECHVGWRMQDNERLAAAAVQRSRAGQTLTAQEYGAWWFCWARSTIASWATRRPACA